MRLLDRYEEIVGHYEVERLRRLGERLAGKRVVHVNSTRVGGGVAEILVNLVPLMQELGISTRWEVIEGDSEFFAVTKVFHNALQGKPLDMPPRLIEHYQEVNRQNALTLRPVLEDADYVFVHDPQPAALLQHCAQRRGRWFWRCHIDVSRPHRPIWKLVRRLVDAGHTVLAAFITPLESLRQAVRGLFRPDAFVEVFLDCPLAICETRDPKGLYCRARKGEIPEFTGISSPFERPCASELVVPTGGQTVDESLDAILHFVGERFPHLALDGSSVRSQLPRRSQRKMAVIGLDCVPPSLIFEEWGKDLCTLRALMEHGTWGSLCGPSSTGSAHSRTTRGHTRQRALPRVLLTTC